MKNNRTQPMYQTVAFNKVRKGQMIMHPDNDEKLFVTYKDYEVMGLGSSENLTQIYIRPTDELWNKNVEVIR